MVCVVLTGMPKCAVPSRISAALVSAAKPCTGSILTMRIPNVRMMRQPPIAVPSPIATAQARMTQVGTSTVLMAPAETSASVMIPIAFCASLAPWLKAMRLEDSSCSRRNARLAAPRGTRNTTQYVARISRYPITNPTSGENSIASSTFCSPDSFTADIPLCASAPPIIPPIRAWDELVGSPSFSVKRFHMIAPDSAAITVVGWIIAASTIPPPIILATAVDMKAPAMFRTAARRTARPGLSTCVETTVAMALALSCQPFEKSKARASTTTRMSRTVGSNMLRREDLCGHGQEATTREAPPHACFRMMRSRMLATSSHRSVPSSRLS